METRTHIVKTWPQFFQDQLDGLVTFQTRYNMDRNYQRGDRFIQKEWQPNPYPNSPDSTMGQFTGRELAAHIVYVASGFGQSPGYVTLQLQYDIADELKLVA